MADSSMNPLMRLGYEWAIRDAEEQMSAFLGPVHAARIAVRKMSHREHDEKGFLIGVEYDDRGLPK